MKRIWVLVAILLIAAGSLYLAQHRKRRDVVSVNAVVDAAADWQRDLSRAPMHLTRISDNEEVRIGDELAQQYAFAAPDESASNAAMGRYLNEVGSRVAAHAHRKLAFRFHLIASADLINAFALPGGHVFVGQGLLDQMTSKDELAFVLGHEIEHIDHYHAVERVQIEAQLNHLNLDLLAAIAQIPVSLWQAGYSKEEEFEADREGLRIANAAGYSAQGAVNLLERWVHLHDEYVTHAETPPEALSKLAIDGLSGYFRTHPLPSERLAQAREVIAQDHLPLSKSLKPFHVEYEVTNGEQ